MDKITGDERMIDTDKYEGHTPAPWKWNTDDVLVGGYLPLVAFDNDGQQNQRTLNLIADAPLLLAEVERLREDIVSILGAIDLPDYDEFPNTQQELRNMMIKYGQERLIHEVIE